MSKVLLYTTVLILLCGFQSPAEAVNSHKIVMGSLMMAGGAALSAIAISDSIFSEDFEDFQFWAGVGLLAGGGVLLVWGLMEDNKNQMNNKIMPDKKAWELGIAVAPRRGGLSAGMMIRW